MTVSHVLHEIPPVFDANSQILILGSFPSVKSRQAQFFYGHPQNRFWKVLAGVFGTAVPQTAEEKKAFLLRHRIALWDVIAVCDIQGSSDSSIRGVIPNDISAILSSAPVQAIYTNGAAAHRLYVKHCYPCTGRMAVKLPSTSPANAGCSLKRLIQEWRQIRRDTVIS